MRRRYVDRTCWRVWLCAETSMRRVRRQAAVVWQSSECRQVGGQRANEERVMVARSLRRLLPLRLAQFAASRNSCRPYDAPVMPRRCSRPTPSEQVASIIARGAQSVPSLFFHFVRRRRWLAFSGARRHAAAMMPARQQASVVAYVARRRHPSAHDVRCSRPSICASMRRHAPPPDAPACRRAAAALRLQRQRCYRSLPGGGECAKARGFRRPAEDISCS